LQKNVVSHEAENTVISVLAKTLQQETEVTSIALRNQTQDGNQEPLRMRTPNWFLQNRISEQCEMRGKYNTEI
jgi:hypothetical protein